MRGECPNLKKRFRKQDSKNKGKEAKAMVATWPDEDSEEHSSDSSSPTSSQRSEKEISFMVYKENQDEVNSSPKNFTIAEWEEAYDILFKNYKKIIRENKGLKKKD